MSCATSQYAFAPDRVRDYALLLRRWKRLVKKHRFLRLRYFTEAGGYPLMVVESSQPREDNPSVYLSAGIHGDEPAPVEALIQWAEEALPRMKGWAIQIFPCLNPWGVERNSRFDEKGRDLNRCYHSRKVPQIAAQLEAMKGRRFDLALALHEDYDARGFYLYEISSRRPYWGEELRDELSKKMPFDPRSVIEGRVARKGLIRRRIDAQLLNEMKGYPEAIRLHLHHAERTLTFETPSEDFLAHRIDVHREFAKLAIAKLLPPN